MAQKEKVIVELEVNAGDGVKDIKKVNEGLNDVQDNSKKAAKEAKSAGSAFGSLGDSIKALTGAGIVLKIFEKFGEILSGNSKITKILSTATEALSIVVSDLVTFLSDNLDGVVKFFKDAFENPGKTIKNLGNLIKENIIERFQSAIEVGGFLAEGLKKLFQGDFAGAINSAKKASKEFVDVLTGVDDSADKIVNLADKVIKYGENVIKTAKKNVDFANSAELAAERLNGLIEKYDRLAEKERQIRDDTSKSIEQRIEANKRLGEVLEDSQKAQLQQAGLLIQAAENNLKKDRGSIELQKTKIAAENQYAAVLAQVEGFRSEQLINQTALLLEQQNLEKTRIQSINSLYIAQKRANADLITDELERAKAKRIILDTESELEITRLKDNVKLYVEGTQAKVDAEIELNTKLQEIAINKQLADIEIKKIESERLLEDLETIKNYEFAKFDTQRAAIDAELNETQRLYDQKLISEREYTKKTKALQQERVQIDNTEREIKEQNANAIGGILGALSGLAEQGTALQKGLALAQVAIDTGTAISALVAHSSKNPLNSVTFGSAGMLQYATGLIQILTNIAKAKSIIESVPGGSSTSAPGVTPTAIAPITPQFTQAQTVNLSSDTMNKMNNVAMRAYVVESDISNSQQRIKRLENSATF